MSRLIDADALMQEFAEFVRDSNNSDFADVPTWNDAVSLLGSAPTIEERKKGKWLPDNNNPYETRFICSACMESQAVPTIGFTKYKPLWDYCPYCGADMREGNQ